MKLHFIIGLIFFTSLPSFSSTHRSTAQVLPEVPWWNLWPRFTLGKELSQVKATSSNVVVAADGFMDEGRCPLFREIVFDSNKNNIELLHSEGIRQLSWIEGQGQSRSIIGLINRTGPSTFEIDHGTGAAQIKAQNWSWDKASETLLSNPLNVVWFGPTSFVNSEDWLGPFKISNPKWNLAIPTYPDGRLATGWLGGSSDPRNSRVYDAIGCKDINGRLQNDLDNAGQKTLGKLKVTLPDGSIKCVGDMSIGRDQASPWWLSYDLASAKYLLEHGADGFWEDNISGWDTIGAKPIDVAFGDWSVAKFRDFLVKSPFKLMGSSNFDIRNHLKSKLREWTGANSDQVTDLSYAGWKDKRFLTDPLWLSFLVYKASLSGTRAREIYKGIKALAQNPNEIYIGGNDAPSLTYGNLNGEEQDGVNTETTSGYSLELGNTGRGIPPYGHAGPFYATAVEFGKSQHSTVWFYLEGEGEAYRQKTSLGEILGYEALANNSLLNFNPSDPRTKNAGTIESALHVNRTIEKMAPTFKVRNRTGEVALFHSGQTRLSWLTPGGFYGFDKTITDSKDFGFMDHNMGFQGWGAELEEKHIPYVVIPDFKFSLDHLKNISLLILPHVRVLDLSVIRSIIIPYLKSGGNLIVTGSNSGSLSSSKNFFKLNRDELGNQTDLISEIKKENLFSKVTYREDNSALDFLVSRNQPTSIKHLNAIKSLDSALLALQQNHTLREKYDFGSWGKSVWMTSYLQPVSTSTEVNFIFDFINVDIDLKSDQIYPSSGGDFTVTNPKLFDALKSKTYVAIFYDGDLKDAVPIKYKLTSEKTILFHLPSFRIYGSLVLTSLN